MADPPRPQVITATVLVEGGSESLERTRSYVIQAIKSSCRNVRDGSVVIALHDENDRLIGLDISGMPSQALQDEVDKFTDKFEG